MNLRAEEPDTSPDSLRRRALEKLLSYRRDRNSLTPEDTASLLEELEINRIELEIQNEEMRRVQEELSESRNLFIELYEFAPVGYLTLDGTGIIRRANLEIDVLCGWEREKLIGIRVEKLVIPEHRDAFFLLVRNALAYGTPSQGEFLVDRLDGRSVWVKAAVTRPVRTGRSKEELKVTLSDITVQKQAEESLRETIRRAEKDRSAAEEANAAKSEFLAHMSHEIRTPIGGIMGMVDVLMSRIDNAEHLSYLALVKESARSLLAIINDILDLSRIESGHVRVETDDTEIAKEIESVVAPLRIQAEEKGLVFSLELTQAVPRFIRTDAGKLAQIMRNLVSNAVKYTDEGKVTVRVDADGVTDGKTTLRIDVADTGKGIPKDRQEAVFESFVRLRHSVTERNVEGTGLGLTIVRQLLVLLGGGISLRSAPGAGSVFSFSLPVELTEKPRGGVFAVPVPVLKTIPPMRILVVEDNRINRMFLETMLADAGHSVSLASDGKEALETVRSTGGFDLVLMDVQMPVMDGIDATRAIRRLPEPVSRIPIIALTAFAMAGDEERFLSAGMNGYVTKPVDWDELQRAIMNAKGN